MKVTMYVTPEQWKMMSAWNIKHLEQGEETWLLMSHASVKEQEYRDALKEFREGADRALAQYRPATPIA